MKPVAILLASITSACGFVCLALAGCSKALPTAPGKPAAAAQAKALTPAKFFATAAVQAQAPGAFVLSANGLETLEAIEAVAPAQRAKLVALIQAEPALAAGIQAFPTLTLAQQRPILERVVALESRANGVKAPTLTFHEEEGRGAFFEFDLAKPGTGTVHLWPNTLAKDAEPYSALLLAIHETRHSWQLQTAFGAPTSTLGKAFKAGFAAQTALEGKLNFSDFCTMHHEHEAFQAGNQIVGMLTGFTADTAGMGCWSSQFDASGQPRIDLLALTRKVGPAGILAAFNRAQQGQFEAMGGKPAR